MSRVIVVALCSVFVASIGCAEDYFERENVHVTPSAIQAWDAVAESAPPHAIESRPETPPLHTELDAALDALLALPGGERMRAFGAIYRKYRLQTFEAHLGANGEFIGGPLRSLGSRPPLLRKHPDLGTDAPNTTKVGK